ncbi:nucleotidyltransferase family protein [Propylenella binzhouense]|uniref:Nucleotidyltransferase family protein n=1 Tax=Propylenella binzhouense TaxID=2555902 RepID=A0A964T3G5_9HYPH|nr:nucleotidyltransferase family protein [Propylenella binzhouense]MYZ47604.1 nucleotidyltransferase family protein [Propylenella binzhouense]
MARPKTAMVLAAGFGKRMRPLTATTPKPLIEVRGRALIDHCLDGLAEAGIETAVVNVHYLADLVEAHLARRSAPAVIVSDEREKLLDTGGGILKALPLLGEGAFVLRNSDSFWVEGVRANMEWLLDAWDDARMDALLLVASTVNSAGYEGRGDFFLNKEGLLARRDERTVAPFVYAGAAILHPRLFRDAPAGPFSLNLLFDRAIEQERLFGVRLDGLWINVETPRAVKAAELAIAESAA